MTGSQRALLALLVVVLMGGLVSSCAGGTDFDLETTPELPGLTWTERVPLDYAQEFAIDRYQGGYSLLSISNGRRYLLVPEGGEIPANLDESIAVIQLPVQGIYLAASSAMSLFDALDALDTIAFTGTQAQDWSLPAAQEALAEGTIVYAGKYRDPDYELLLSAGCPLAIESTMITHVPQVKEKLEDLGIVVLEERSSYESHPLGRSEWVKVYGELTGKGEKAQALFDQQKAALDQVSQEEPTGKTVAFFYLNSAGQVVTRKYGDYVTKMIQLAGGTNAFQSLGEEDDATSTVTLEMEQFYAEAKDADVILYNGTIGGEVSSLEELLEKNELLRQFKAVQTGQVWCTQKNLYQESLALGTVIADIHTVLTDPHGEAPLTFLYPLT